MSTEAQSASGSSRGSAVWLVGLALALTVISWAAYRSVFELPHLGWDTWPMIATARIESWSDFVGTFTEKLMDGRYPLGDFYRPVTNLSVALDYALWGTEPAGYHATDFAIVVGSALLVAVLVARLFGSRIAAALAAFAFALHPVHWESLPVTARRADTLSVFFVLAWLSALPLKPADDEASSRSWLREVGVLLLAFAAVGAKETGALIVGLAVVLLALAPGGASRKALVRSTIVTLIAVGVFVAARTAVLGGLGGHGESSISAGFQNGPGLIDEYGGLVLVPQPWFAQPADNAKLALGVTVALVLALLIGLARKEDAKARLLGIGFLLLWLAGLLVMTGMSGELRSWYSIPFLPIWCGLLGAAAAGAARAGRSAPLVAGATGVLILGAVVVPLRFTGFAHDYAEWKQIGVALDTFFVQAEADLGRASGGQVVQIPSPPAALSAPMTQVGVRAASGIADYGVQAWADVRYSAGAVRVHDARRGATRQNPNEILLVLTPPRPMPR